MKALCLRVELDRHRALLHAVLYRSTQITVLRRERDRERKYSSQSDDNTQIDVSEKDMTAIQCRPRGQPC